MVDHDGKRRQSRVSVTVRNVLAGLLVKATNDPRLAWVTVTGVEMSPDLRSAKVYFSTTLPDQGEPVEKSLKRAAPYLQRELGSRLNLRFTPKLAFFRDDSFAQGARIEELIREVRDAKQDEVEEQGAPGILARLVAESERILLATHRNPDGDAIGSLLGLSAVLRLMGRSHVTYCPDGIPKLLAFLPGSGEIARTLENDDQFDLTIMVDTADENLFPDGFPGPDRRGSLVVIDHHEQHGGIGDVVIRREAAAVGEILFDLTRELVWPLDAKAAECLYTSIVSDTGSFRYSSTTEKTHRVTAELLAAGARPWIVATHLFESYPLNRQKLLGEVLRTLEVSGNGRYACLFSTPDMLVATGARREDLDGMINLGRAVDGVEISAMFRVEQNGDIKVSFRSKGLIDVGRLAVKFGGGGHRNAAGCTLKGLSLEAAQKKIREAADEVLADHDAEASAPRQT